MFKAETYRSGKKKNFKSRCKVQKLYFVSICETHTKLENTILYALFSSRDKHGCSPLEECYPQSGRSKLEANLFAFPKTCAFDLGQLMPTAY